MDLALRNAIQMHIADDLDNLYNFNERPRFHSRDEAFELPERQFIRLFRLNKTTVDQIIDIVKANSQKPSRSSALDVNTQVIIE